MWNQKIQRLASQESDGLLPAILFPSAVYYIDHDYCTICWECANKDKDDEVYVVIDYALDYTDENGDISVCDNCGKSIDPALR